MSSIFVIIIIFFSIFVIASFSSSLGIGGGIFTVPLLLYLSKISNLPDNSIVFIAVSNSLLVTLVFSIFATYINIYLKQIEFSIAINFLLGSIPSTFLGAFISQYLSTKQFKTFFGIIVLFIGIYSLLRSYQFSFPFERKTQIKEKEFNSQYFFSIKSKFLIFSFGVLTGLISSLTGIGGGLIMVPLFSYYLQKKKSYYVSIGTSTFCMFFITLSSTISYLTLYKVTLPSPSFGYYYLPFTIPLLLGAIPGGILGSKIKGKIPEIFLKRVLSILQIIVGLKTLFW